jgi:hypothetical protein
MPIQGNPVILSFSSWNWQLIQGIRSKVSALEFTFEPILPQRIHRYLVGVARGAKSRHGTGFGHWPLSGEWVHPRQARRQSRGVTLKTQLKEYTSLVIVKVVSLAELVDAWSSALRDSDKIAISLSSPYFSFCDIFSVFFLSHLFFTFAIHSNVVFKYFVWKDWAT